MCEIEDGYSCVESGNCGISKCSEICSDSKMISSDKCDDSNPDAWMVSRHNARSRVTAAIRALDQLETQIYVFRVVETGTRLLTRSVMTTILTMTMAVVAHVTP